MKITLLYKLVVASLLTLFTTLIYAQQLVNFSCSCGEAVTGFDSAGFAICRPFDSMDTCPNSTNYSFVPSTGSIAGAGNRFHKSYISFNNQQYWPESPYGSLDNTDLGGHNIVLLGYQNLLVFQIALSTPNLPENFISSIEFVEAGITYDFSTLPSAAHIPNWIGPVDNGSDIMGTLWQFSIPQADYDALITGANYTIEITLTN